MKSKKTPVGVIIVAALMFFSALAGLLLLTIPSLLYKILGIVGVVLFILIGIGLLMRRSIARWALIVVYSLSLVFNIIVIILNLAKVIDVPFRPSDLTRMIIAAAVLWYMFKPAVKKIFK